VLGAAAVRRGFGVGYLPESMVAVDLDGTLVRLQIGDWHPPTRELFAVYPATRQLSSRVRAVIDYAVAGRNGHV
jgi:DNA-binding transcriptional LysR family regulator